MRRLDAVLLLAVSAFAVFIGAQVFHTSSARAAMHKKPAPVASSPLARPVIHVGQQGPVDVGSDSSELSTTFVTSAQAAPVRDEADIRSRIAAVASGTYMGDMVADLNGMLVRWPDRPGQPLRVWIQSKSDLPDYQAGDAQTAQEAFADWQHSGFPLRFDFVLDSATADIRLIWTDRFPPDAGLRVGSTRRTSDQHGWIADAQILVALHDSAGTVIPPAALGGIVKHEAGHALGLGHSRDEKTMMFPTEIVHDIAPADRNTLRLLYSIPPGPLK
ncbi:MAG TPA: matrixin family metalloprotease [Gemmatimonadaceae bacterium]